MARSFQQHGRAQRDEQRLLVEAQQHVTEGAEHIREVRELIAQLERDVLGNIRASAEFLDSRLCQENYGKASPSFDFPLV